MNPADREPSGTPLLTLRAAVILLLGVLSGVGAGILAFFADNDLATCAMAGCGSAAMAVLFFHAIIKDHDCNVGSSPRPTGRPEATRTDPDTHRSSPAH